MSVGLPVPLGWGSLVGLLYTLSCCQKGLMGSSGSQIETGTPFLELWWNRHKKTCKWNSLTAELLPYSRYLRKALILTFTVPENPSVFAFNFLLRFLDGRSQAWSPLTFFFHFFFKLDSELWGGAQSIGLKAFYLNDSRLYCVFWYLILENVWGLTKSDSSPSSSPSPSGDSSDSCSSSRGFWMRNEQINRGM